MLVRMVMTDDRSIDMAVAATAAVLVLLEFDDGFVERESSLLLMMLLAAAAAETIKNLERVEPSLLLVIDAV